MHISAGFRAIVRRPALVLGEIVWRWAFGAAAWALVIVALRRLLAHVDITQIELLIARHSDVFLIADGGARIVVQVLPQLGRECLVLAPAIAALWITSSSLGRAITLDALMARPASRPHFGQIAWLHLLRAVFTMATLIGLVGALVLTGLAMSAKDPTSAALAGILVAAVIGLFWSLVNWFLALAPIWIVRDGRSVFRSIAESVDLYRRSPGPYFGIASWFGVWRAAALVAAFAAAVFASKANPATSIALFVAIALIYFAIADFLYMVRLAALVALAEGAQLSAISVPPIAPEAQLKADN